MARPTDGLSGVRWASGDGPVRTPAPTGLGHRTWFMKMFAGAHNVYLSFPSTASTNRRGAQCAPLQTVYRSIPIDEGWRAEAVAPYGDLYNNSIAGKYGGICRTGPAKQPSSSGGKSWRGWQSGNGGLPQSYRREDALKIPSTKQEQPPPRWGRQGWTSAGLSRGNASWGS